MSTVRGDSKWLRFVLQRRADESGTLFISGTVQDSTKAKQLQAVQLENVKNLKFTEELIVSQELERKRISAELHDGIGQELLLITNYAEMATDLVPKRNAKIADYLERISGNSNKLVGIIREIIYGLHPIYLDKLGLTETLVHTISTLCETNKITLETDIDEIDHELSKSDEVHLYRIIQELCSNAVKYSNAKVIRFSTENTPESLKVTFTDFGVGFDYQNKIDDNRPHFGLENIKHRCSLINAELHFASVLGEKTTCEIQILKNSLA
jgi:signal transduction histidine kinase